jgi:hypothetical protein
VLSLIITRAVAPASSQIRNIFRPPQAIEPSRRDLTQKDGARAQHDVSAPAAWPPSTATGDDLTFNATNNITRPGASLGGMKQGQSTKKKYTDPVLFVLLPRESAGELKIEAQHHADNSGRGRSSSRARFNCGSY